VSATLNRLIRAAKTGEIEPHEKAKAQKEPSDQTLCRRLKMAIPWHEEQGHPETVSTLAAAARRIDRARREHAALVLAMTTLGQIAGGQRNTMDRRNARATLAFLDAINTEADRRCRSETKPLPPARPTWPVSCNSESIN
jgi:hypothetical protein